MTKRDASSRSTLSTSTCLLQSVCSRLAAYTARRGVARPTLIMVTRAEASVEGAVVPLSVGPIRHSSERER